MSDIEDRINKLQDLINTQGDSGNWDYDPYMHGLYNGMCLARSVFDDEEPDFKDSPEHWLADFDTMDKLNKSGTTIEVTENE